MLLNIMSPAAKWSFSRNLLLRNSQALGECWRQLMITLSMKLAQRRRFKPSIESQSLACSPQHCIWKNICIFRRLLAKFLPPTVPWSYFLKGLDLGPHSDPHWTCIVWGLRLDPDPHKMIQIGNTAFKRSEELTTIAGLRKSITVKQDHLDSFSANNIMWLLVRFNLSAFMLLLHKTLLTNKKNTVTSLCS